MPGTTLGTAYVQIVPSSQGISGSISNVLSGEAESAGVSVGGKIASFAKKAILAAGIGTAIVGIIKSSIDEGGKLQQSYIGGLDTLYGKAADTARSYAKDAAKAGISMNEYSEQAVSFGAALKKAYGGDAKKAVEAANMAILDMADNSAKMGTDMTMIQNAYQGFAKQNYTMLDNLKLGYGGTKTEMQRLLKDAEALTGVKYDINNLGDVYEAIHVIQGELGLTGTAAYEAGDTFTGSFASMKAAAKNFLGELALGMDVSESLNVLTKSAVNFFFNNFIPMLGNIIRSIPGAIFTFLKEGAPLVVKKISELLTSLAKWLQEKADGLTAEKVTAWIKTTLPKILAAAGKLIGQFAMALLKNLPKIVSALGQIGIAIVRGLGSALWEKVSAAARGIRDRFMAPINNIKERFSAIIDKIKSWFPIKLGKIFKGIKLPHFKIKGGFSLVPPKVPHIGVEWYDKGGIFNSPAVIGVGEKRPEFVGALDDLRDIVREESGNGGPITINVYPSQGMNETELAYKVEQVLARAQKRRNLAYGNI